MKKLTILFLSFVFSMTLAQAPTGYYTGTDGLTGAQLKTRLYQIISSGTIDLGYDGLYSAYPSTDTDRYYENDGSVLDIYSEKPNGTDPYTYRHGQKRCGNYSVEGDCYNREHIVPQSFYGEKRPMVSDLHQVRPTDGKVNGMRSNYPFGMVNNPSYTSKNGTKIGPSVSPGYSGTVCEPIDEFKGDVARMILYFVTRYETQLSSFTSGNILGGSPYPGLQAWERDVLLAWHAQDPVSPAEIDRNNATFSIQKNRNPFIDRPEWVQQIWGGTTIIDNQAPTAPSNLQVDSTSIAFATLSWSASTDNVAVTYYKIYVNGVFHSNSVKTTATVSGLSQGTTYSFYVTAADAAGNTSAQSNTVTATTLTDTQAPTAPTNLAVSNIGSNSVSIQWSAATDNYGVTSYDIYVNGELQGSTIATSSNVSNLSPATTYNIFVVAKDAAGNVSPASNTITATTNSIGINCGDENFDNIPAASSNYSTYNWTSKGISWTSEDSRTDQTINGPAITIRNGFLTALSVPNGIGNLTVTTQLKYSGSSGTLKILVNGEDTGKTVPYSSQVTTTTVTGINISGTVEITLQNTSTGNRVAIDDMKWTCYATASVKENGDSTTFTISPNPVKNGELNVRGTRLTDIESAQIFDFSGKMIQSVSKPFKNGSAIKLNNLPKGLYILKVGQQNAKFIVQ